MLLSKVFTYHFIQLKFLFLYYLLTYCFPFIKINIFMQYILIMISPPQVLWEPLLMIFIYLLCVCASAPASTWRSEDGIWGWFLQSILWFPGLFSSGCRFWRHSPLPTQPSQQPSYTVLTGTWEAAAVRLLLSLFHRAPAGADWDLL